MRTALCGYVKGDMLPQALEFYEEEGKYVKEVVLESNDDKYMSPISFNKDNKDTIVQEMLEKAFLEHKKNYIDIIYIVEAEVGEDGKIILGDDAYPLNVVKEIYIGSGLELEEFISNKNNLKLS